ncbi:MAG TPA: SPOR domain-containing protein [Kiloniellaceae bacterium]|nr:SPOR domain-containing protein [Kiloniellaceae bacterium]
MSVDWHDERYIESEDDEGFGGRLRQAFRRGWSKSGRGPAADDETAALEGALRAELKPRKPWLPLLLTLVALIAFGTVIWYAYNWGKGSLDSSALPVIAGDSSPIKVRPADEGGVVIPDQDKLIFDSSLDGEESASVEHLLPAPEEPVDLAAVTAVPESPAVQGLGHQLTASPPPAAVEPSVQSEDVIAQAIQSEALSTAAPAAPDATAGATPEPAPAPAPAKPAAVQTAQVPTDSGYLLQLAAMQDPEAANQEWARLQSAYPDLLGSLSLTVEKADVGGKTYYRILTGPFPTKATVEDICSQLKAKSQSCLVKKQAP